MRNTAFMVFFHTVQVSSCGGLDETWVCRLLFQHQNPEIVQQFMFMPIGDTSKLL